MESDSKTTSRAIPPWIVFLCGLAAGFYLRGVIPSQVLNSGSRGESVPSASPARIDPKDAAFATLWPERQQFVINSYQLALDLYKKQDYRRCLLELERLHALLPLGYRDSFDIKSYAQKALDVTQEKKDSGAR